jgi:transcription elongation factor Elf1
MICIFCKQNSSSSISIEHIVPESLGNKQHILEKGIVCDKCNQYFALKIEKKVLETDFFTNIRFRNRIESKKRKIPKGKAIMPINNYEADIIIDKKNEVNVILDPENFELIIGGKIKHLIVPVNNDIPKNSKDVSRLLAKIGLEMLALRVIKDSEDHNDFANEIQLDPIRNYVRYNHKNENWVYHTRKLYEEDEKFYFKNGESADMIFECDFLPTKKTEIYFIIAFKGIEFTINMAGSSIEGYQEWLAENNNESPLYTKGKHFGYKLTPEFMKKK